MTPSEPAAVVVSLTATYLLHSTLWILAAWLALRASSRAPTPGGRDVLAVGLAVGLAAGTRVAGLSLLPATGALWLASLWLRGREAEPSRAWPSWAHLGRLALAWTGTLVVGWVVVAVAGAISTPRCLALARRRTIRTTPKHWMGTVRHKSEHNGHSSVVSTMW